MPVTLRISARIASKIFRKLGNRSYGQFIQPNFNFAAGQGLQNADQGTFGQLTGLRRHPILRISPCLLG
jgi:hypothetical protein